MNKEEALVRYQEYLKTRAKGPSIPTRADLERAIPHCIEQALNHAEAAVSAITDGKLMVTPMDVEVVIAELEEAVSRLWEAVMYIYVSKA